MFRDPLINIYVQDVERVARFYATLLGFQETFRTPASGVPDHVELRLEGLTLGVASIDAARRMHGFTAGSGAPRSEVALWCDDVDATYADLIANGAGQVSEPHDFLGRLRAGWVSDPEGNHVQVVMHRSDEQRERPSDDGQMS